MSSQTLIFKSGSPVGEIILNQPAKRNAINTEMWRKLGILVAEAVSEKQVKVIVVRGEGEHFAAGADISEFEQTYATRKSATDYTETMLKSLGALKTCTKPTIAMIKGSCVGGGCSVALACDFRFASNCARFGVTPGKLGLVYSVADTRRLIQAVGLSSAKDLLMTGRLIDAKEAEAISLCDRLYDADKLETGTYEYAEEIAATSQWSVRATKHTFQMIENGFDDDADEAMAIMLEAFEGTDFKEGYSAFQEKRKTNFPTE